MTRSHYLSQLRFGLKLVYALQEREHATTRPGLHYLLSIPIRERLILLGSIDDADEREIRRAIKVSKDDATLSSRRMKRTLQRVKANLPVPHAHWPEVWTRVDLTPEGDLTNGIVHEESLGIAWNRRYGEKLETHLGQLLWSDVAVASLGQSVPPEIARLSLKQRLILYCVLVDGRTQDETIQIMGCTEWDIDRSLRDGVRAVGGV